MQRIFARVERQPLLAGCLDHEHRLAGVDVLADLGDDHADNAVGRRPQDGLVEPPLEHRERGRRRLDLRVRDGTLLFRRPGDCGVVVGLRLGDVGACARHVVLRLVERLLRGGLAARQGRSVRLSCCSAYSSRDFALAISAVSEATCSARTPA